MNRRKKQNEGPSQAAFFRRKYPERSVTSFFNVCALWIFPRNCARCGPKNSRIRVNQSPVKYTFMVNRCLDRILQHGKRAKEPLWTTMTKLCLVVFNWLNQTSNQITRLFTNKCSCRFEILHRSWKNKTKKRVILKLVEFYYFHILINLMIFKVFNNFSIYFWAKGGQIRRLRAHWTHFSRHGHVQVFVRLVTVDNGVIFFVIICIVVRDDANK